MTRGFVTVATGDEIYYEIASNLLKSYRLRCGNTYKFAILCDRENEYTADFDDVVIINNARCNYTDKFRILTDCPYDESIFIESDCLIYDDINIFWQYFEGATDFSTFGWNKGNFGPWFDEEGFENVIGSSIIPIFCPGYLFIRKGEICNKMYDDALKISEYLYKHKEENPKCFVRGTLRDDPVFSCIMVMNDCKCAVKPEVGKCISLTSEKKPISPHISRGVLKYGDRTQNGNLLHFSSSRTKEGVYLHQVFVMNCMINKITYAKIIDCFMVRCFFSVYSMIKNRSYRELSRALRKFLKKK